MKNILLGNNFLGNLSIKNVLASLSFTT